MGQMRANGSLLSSVDPRYFERYVTSGLPNQDTGQLLSHPQPQPYAVIRRPMFRVLTCVLFRPTSSRCRPWQSTGIDDIVHFAS